MTLLNVPVPEVTQIILPLPDEGGVVEVLKSYAAMLIQTVSLLPALAAGVLFTSKYKIIKSLAAPNAHIPVPVTTSVRVTLPLAISAALGV